MTRLRQRTARTNRGHAAPAACSAAGRKRELPPSWVDDFTGALTSDQLSFEEVLLTPAGDMQDLKLEVVVVPVADRLGHRGGTRRPPRPRRRRERGVPLRAGTEGTRPGPGPGRSLLPHI